MVQRIGRGEGSFTSSRGLGRVSKVLALFGRDGVGGGGRGGGGVAAGRQRGGRRPTEGGSPRSRRRPAVGLAFDWFLLRFRFFLFWGELLICSWGFSCCRGTRPRRCCPSRPSRSPPRPRSTSASSLRSFPSSCLRLLLSCANHVVISTNLAAPLAFIYRNLRDCCLVSPLSVQSAVNSGGHM